MKKLIFVFIFLIIGQIYICAQKISYKSYKNQDLEKLTTFQGIRYFEITVKGDFKGKMIKLVQHVYHNGQETIKEDAYQLQSRKVIFEIWAQPAIEGDSVKIGIKTPFFYQPHFYIHMDVNDRPILMETFLSDYKNLEVIPLVAYTPGIKSVFYMNGENYTAIDYCGVRDAHIHPSEWKEKFGILNYLYYELKIE